MSSGVIIAIIVSLLGASVVSVSVIRVYHDVKKDALDNIRRTKEFLAKDKPYKATHKKIASS